MDSRFKCILKTHFGFILVSIVCPGHKYFIYHFPNIPWISNGNIKVNGRTARCQHVQPSSSCLTRPMRPGCWLYFTNLVKLNLGLSGVPEMQSCHLVSVECGSNFLVWFLFDFVVTVLCFSFLFVKFCFVPHCFLTPLPTPCLFKIAFLLAISVPSLPFWSLYSLSLFLWWLQLLS